MTSVKADSADPVLLDLPLPITTPRLLLRPYREGDGVLVAAAIAESWNDLHPWLHDDLDKKERETNPHHQEVFARQRAMEFASRESLQFVILDRQTNALIGCAGLANPNWRIPRFDLYYWIATSRQRQGYATEAANALTRYAFAVLQARVVTIGRAVTNEASGRIIAKLGFSQFASNRYNHEMPDGTLVDTAGYARTDTDGLPPLKVSWN